MILNWIEEIEKISTIRTHFFSKFEFFMEILFIIWVEF